MKQIVIAIDPGKDTGYAEYDLVSGELKLKTLSFWECYDNVMLLEASVLYGIYVEVSSVGHVWHPAGGVRQAGKIGQNVGGVKVQGGLLLERFLEKGYPAEAFEPMGKVNAGTFGGLTGYVGRTNQHERDAGMKAFTVGISLK